jgi:hypothetical protein
VKDGYNLETKFNYLNLILENYWPNKYKPTLAGMFIG